MKFILSHVSFISTSHSENCIKICFVLIKLQTKISWLLFMATVHSVPVQKTAKHRAKFGWPPLSDVGAVTKPRRETRWNLSAPNSPTDLSRYWVEVHYCEDMRRRCCCLWSPYGIGQTIIFLPCNFYLLFFSSPNLGGRRLHVCYTSTHGVALVRI